VTIGRAGLACGLQSSTVTAAICASLVSPSVVVVRIVKRRARTGFRSNYESERIQRSIFIYD
jgi:hypothetical protein